MKDTAPPTNEAQKEESPLFLAGRKRASKPETAGGPRPSAKAKGSRSRHGPPPRSGAACLASDRGPATWRAGVPHLQRPHTEGSGHQPPGNRPRSCSPSGELGSAPWRNTERISSASCAGTAVEGTIDSARHVANLDGVILSAWRRFSLLRLRLGTCTASRQGPRLLVTQRKPLGQCLVGAVPGKIPVICPGACRLAPNRTARTRGTRTADSSLLFSRSE